MNKNQIIALISKVRRDSSIFLEKELALVGIKNLISSHGAVMAALFRNSGKLKMKDIANIINKDKSTITYLVNGLSKSGYVMREKSEQDSRETYIILTKKAWEMEKKFNAVSEKLIDTAYKGFTEDEKQILLDLLLKMNNNFRE